MPTQFGLSFTAKFLNSAGALVHVYPDGWLFFRTNCLCCAGAVISMFPFLFHFVVLFIFLVSGTVLVNHGGIEMGQGLHSKVRR